MSQPNKTSLTQKLPHFPQTTKDLKIKAMLYFSPQSGPSSTTSSLTLFSICLQTSCSTRHSLKGFPRHWLNIWGRSQQKGKALLHLQHIKSSSWSWSTKLFRPLCGAISMPTMNLTQTKPALLRQYWCTINWIRFLSPQAEKTSARVNLSS